MNFRKSSRCGSNSCVEVDTSKAAQGCVGVRSSRQTRLRLNFTTTEWATFVAAVKAGEFDVDEEG